ncbi:YSIRK-type signal peptide-containing protein [Lactobacillus acidophilus]|uniref:mucin-binding protein n=1 Tax=Lactobacillus acidophilus TaxID=1579 RepID=UPI0021A5A1DA|nr:YSIRK-type signal peptide-containing protein [Lactobacillus acidophilus]MCT3601397.1 YSIRK-type signal peptide-containing protein [Lactobacillus acidophilus]MCT3624138.1 YSIRK-type signal peptide-containing protein [Lactobacillus acidophilus]
MVSKNNRAKQMENVAERQPHFSIRKLTIGAASVLLSTTLWMSVNTSSVNAENIDNSDNDAHEATESNTETPSINDDTKVVVESNSNTTSSANQVSSNADLTQNQAINSTTQVEANNSINDKKANNDTADLSNIGLKGIETNKIPETTDLPVSELIKSYNNNSNSNEVNVNQVSGLRAAQLFAASLVQTTSGSSDATDIANTNIDFNFTDPTGYNTTVTGIPDSQYGYVADYDTSRKITYVLATDRSNPGQTLYLYANGKLVASSSQSTTPSKPTLGGKLTIDQTNGNTYQGGTYNYVKTITSSLPGTGLNTFTRIDVTDADGDSPVTVGVSGSADQSAHSLQMIWNNGGKTVEKSTWQSVGGLVPTPVKQNVWYVDADTGEVLAHKQSESTISGQEYNLTGAQYEKITVNGKTYDLVKRNNGVYDASQLATDKTLDTNNGVAIKASDLLDTPLTGQIKNYRAGDINFTVTNTGPNRLYVTQQLDTKGTVTLNAYDAERYDDTNWKAMYVSAMARSTLKSGGIADGANSEFVNNATNGNQDVIILYKAATPVVNTQNANITFVNDDTGASLSPQQNASGDAGSQISFDNAGSTVANLISQGYIYNGTTGNGVTNGAASGSFTSVGFPFYDNDDNTNQAFVVHFKNPAQTTTYQQGVEESKTIHRTINYYDKVTGAKIPSNFISQNPVTDSVTFTRTQVWDQDGKVVGYGTISSDGKSFRTQDWHTAEGLTADEFAAKKSADLSAFNYTAPEFQDGTSANVVAAHEVTPTTQDLVYNVYYGHQTQQVTTNEDVTRRFHYIFTDGTTPESHLTPQADQKVTFTGTATKDLVTGKTGDTVWTPSTGTLAQVAGQTVAGYHITGNVNANADGSANAVTVNPDSGDIDVTVVYTPDAKTPDTPQKAKVTIYDKTENNKQLSNFENNNGTKGSAISFDGEPQTLQAYLNSGYVFDSATDANGNSIGTASNITFGNFDSVDGNVQSFNIYLVHGTDTKTEKATTNAHVHYVVAGNEANKPAAPADSPTQTINWTRTNTTDKVTGATTEGTWTPDKNGFTSITSPDLTNYTPDQAVANFTTPQPNRDQVVTVVYNPNPEVAQKADLVVYDKTDNNKELNNFDNSGKTGTQISFSGSANYVADLIAKGYKIDSFVNDQNQTSNPTSYDQISFSNFDNNSASDQHFKLYLVHDTENVTDKKTTTSTVHYVVSDGKTNPPSDNTQTITWTRPGTKDKVTGVTTPTGNWTTPDNYTDVPTPNLDGYTPDKTNVPAPTPDPNQNPTTVVTYNPKTPEAPTYTGTTENKTVTRTINYYDKVTGEKIPANLISDNPTTQNVTLSRTHVVSSTGQDMGYGTVSADGKTFTKAPTVDGWNTGDWAQVTSPDLSNAGYTAPDLAQADQVTVDANTNDAVVNVYYGHQTEVITPKTPHNPGGNINPNDPRNKPSVYPDGLTKEALTTEVTRHINYVGVNEDGTTTPVNGSPDGKNTYTQTVSFERNAVIDKVTGQILGYSTDGTTNVTTTDKDRAWTPTTQNMDSVASKTPSEVGYDKVDILTVGGVTVYPGQKVNDVTVTYTKNKSPEVTQKATLEIIDNNDANAPKQLASFSNEGKSEDQINFANSNEILQSYLSQGYKVQRTAGNLSGDAQSGYTYPTYGNTTQDFKIYLIHDIADKTETATATAQVHYVVADNGVQAPADSDLQTITYTRTNRVDKVTGATVNEGTWQADKSAFTDVKSPDLSKDGYTPSLENVQFNAPERNVNQRVTVVYNRSAQAADLQIIDDNDPQNQRVLATYSAGGESGKQISFDGSNTQLQTYLNNGYTFEKYEGQGMSGDAQNGFTYPSFDNDSQSNQSFKIYLKHATANKTATATTTAHVHYIMADGTKAPDDSAIQTINWTQTNTVDRVTGATINEGTWSSDKNAFTDVDSPTVTGYTPGTKTVKFATPERGVNQVVNVVYTKDAPTPDQQNALVVYQDVNDPAHPVDLGQSKQLTGQAGDSINYSTADRIAGYEKQGYVLVSNGFDANDTKPSFDNVNGNTQTFYVTFKHGIQPVRPTTPGIPDQPINPDNPDGPKYPSGTDQTSLTKDVTRTVTYEGAGDQTPSPVTDTLHFQGTGYLDKVTGKWTDANGKELSDQTKGITWTITDGTKDEGSFNLVPTKHIDGYTSKVVTNGADDGNGNVKSYTGITHTSDNINVVVQYNPIVAEQGNLIVKFHDDTDNKDLTGVGTDTGTQDVGTQVTYNPSTDLTNLENKGYVYVSTDGNIPSSIVKGTTTVTIHVKHGTVPVTPDNPGTPDQPINPNDPDPNGPKYPTGTDKASIDKTITRIVHYEGADQYSPNDVKQPVHFTAKGVLDKVTGEWITPLTWSEDQTFNGVNSPKIPGYHVVSVDKDADGTNVASSSVSHTGSDYIVNVVYAKDAVKQAENANLHIIDLSDNNKEIANFNDSGDDNAAINFNGAQTTVDALIKGGYKVNSIVQATSDPNNPTKYGTEYSSAASQWMFDDKPGVDQSFYVYVEHDYAPINPENAYGRTDLTQTVTETVHYIDEATNKPVATDYTNTLTFKGQGRVDKVTGKMLKIKSIENGQITYDYNVANEIDISSAKLSDFAWSTPTTLQKVTSPTIAGYTIDAAKTTPSELADGNDIKEIQNVAYDHGNVEATVYYKANPVETHKAGLTIYANGNQVGTASVTGAKDTAINFGSASDIVAAYISNGYKFDHAQDVTNNKEMTGKSYNELNFGNFATTNNSDQQFAIYLTKDETPAKTQQNAQLTVRDVTPGQEMDLGNYTQPGLEGDAISFSSAQEFVQNLLNKGYVWDGASYNGTNLEATNYAGINFGNYDNTDDKNGISQKWVINLVHGVTPVNPDHPDDKDGFTKDYLDRTITRDVTYVYEDGSQAAAPVHQEAHYQGSGYLDNVTGKWVTVENGKITGLAQGLTWTPDQDSTFDQIGAKNIEGYHVSSVSGNGISGFTVGQDGTVGQQTVTKDTPSSTIRVVYAKTPVTPVPADGSIIYIDDTTGNNLENATFGGTVGAKIDYTTADRISYYQGKGYKLVSNNFTDGSQTFKQGENKFEVHLTHVTETKDATKTITRDVTYVYEDGSQADTPVQQTITFTGKTTSDKVTGSEKTTWNNESQTFGATKAIDTTKYQIVGINERNTTANVDRNTGVVASETITPNSQNSAVVITLANKPETPIPANGSITYYDDTTGTTLESAGFSGSVGQKINYTTTDRIVNYVNKGYDVVSNNFTDGNETFKQGDNKFEVHLVHATTPITPENPGKPGQEVPNPNDPEHPHTIPANFVPQTLTHTVTRDVTYVYADGSQASAPVHQTFTFNGNGVIDLVTGQLVTVENGKITGAGKITWNADSHNFDAIDAIDHDGYYISNVSENNTTANVDTNTGAVAGETITPNSQNSTIVITLTKKPDVPTPVPEQGSIKVTVHDVKTNQDVPGYDKDSGKQNTGTSFTYDKTTTITDLENKGYKVINPNVDIPTKVSNIDQHIVIYVDHNVIPVTPDKPGNGLSENDLNKTVTETVHYVVNGGATEAPADKTTSLKFTGTAYYDSVTKKWTDANGNELSDQSKNITWTAENGNKFAVVITPTLEGYTPSVQSGYDDGNKNVKEINNITPDSGNVEVTVTYNKNNVPTPVKQGTIEIIYHDTTDNVDIPGYGQSQIKEDEGTSFSYNPNAKDLPDLESKGYVLDGELPTIPTKFTDGDQRVVINVKHGTTTVTPDKPGKPGDPIDPNNPDGPKYPEGTGENNLKVTGTQTIHYIGAGDKTPKDNTQSFEFTKQITFDNVTGKIINDSGWNVTSHTFGSESTPVIDGYHADKTTAGGTTVTPNDLHKTVTVTYTPNVPAVPTPTPSPEPKPENTPVEPNTPTPTPDIPDNVTPTPEPENDNVKPHGESIVQKNNDNPKVVSQGQSGNNWTAPHGHRVDQKGNIVTSDNRVVGYVDQNGKAHYTKLPQTGDDQTNDVAAALLGGAAVSLGLIGLAGVKKRRKEDK